MPGQSLFKRALIEKERSIGRRELAGACLTLASSFLLVAGAYSTLTYLAAPPALSHNFDENSQAVKAPAPSYRGLNEPECGVRLLLSILQRLNNGTQVAMLQDGDNRWNFPVNNWASTAKKRRDAALAMPPEPAGSAPSAREQQFNQNLNSNVADPALSIRPQLNKRTALDEIAYNQIAAAPQQAVQLQQAPQGQVSAGASYGTPVSTPMAMTRAKSLNQSNWYKAPMSVKVISDSPNIKEFRAENNSDAKKSLRQTQNNIMEEPAARARVDSSNLVDQSQAKDLAANGSADSVTGIIRPSEQPGLFKYVREYYKDTLKNMPAPAATVAPSPSAQNSAGTSYAEAGKSNDDYEITIKEGAQAGSGGKGGSLASYEADKIMGRGYNVKKSAPLKKSSSRVTRIAFLPPNAVHGILGLPLGASTSETVTFFKAHGKMTMQNIAGFHIFTLHGDNGNTMLQAFVRDDRLEALRVFSSAFVPVQLGVNLGEDVVSMKAKFGEPAFILEEPRVKEKAPPMIAKNYVYPVSQVSFQLSRPNAAASPQVLSLFLFRFL